MADAHAYIGVAKVFLGRGAETEAHMQEALRLSPRDTVAYLGLCLSVSPSCGSAPTPKRLFGSPELEANRNYPFAHFHLAAALAHVGELDEARAAAQAGLALDPSFTIRRFRTNAPSNHPRYLAGRERIYEGMRMAGVPEG